MAKVLSLYPLVLLAAVWELVARTGLTPPIFLPAFSHVVADLFTQLLAGNLFGPLCVSVFRAFTGFVIAGIIGVTIGIAMAQFTWFNRFMAPIISTGFPAPKIALLPIFILWFGIDHMSKILLVAFVCVFPFIVAAYGAASTVPRAQIWAAQAMNTSRAGMLFRIVLPASFPSLLSGVRVAIPQALVSAFTAEMIAGGGGLGGELVYAQRFFETTTVFEILLLMLALGYVIDILFLKLRTHTLRWHEQAASKE
ncbi:ABC transporter permease [Xanthobacteraceae bacterium A53D]